MKNFVLTTIIVSSLGVASAYGKTLLNKNKYLECWTPLSTEDVTRLTNTKRTASNYLSVLLSLDVEHNYRYEPKAVVKVNGKQMYMPYSDYEYWKGKVSGLKFLYKETYCNIYGRDCCRLLGCPIPDMCSNELFQWFKTAPNWKNVSYTQAIANANKGMPTVMIMRRGSGCGHTAMVRPSRYKDLMMVSQAGRNCIEGSFWRDKGSSNTKFYTYTK